MTLIRIRGLAGPPGATGPLISGRRVGQWYATLGAGGTVDFEAVPSDLHLAPIYIAKEPLRLDRLGALVFSGAQGTCQLGLYNSLANGFPSTRLVGSGNITIVNGTTSFTINELLNPGLYWIGFIFTASTSPRFVVEINHAWWPVLPRPSKEGVHGTGYRVQNAGSTLPATFNPASFDHPTSRVKTVYRVAAT